MENKFASDPRFYNCLRAQIYPDEYADERIESIKRFCLRYGIQNVILIFNGEEYNVGHITKDQCKPWIEVIKRAKKEFAEVGVTTSLNPWIEIGHLDRGRTLQPGQNFQTMMDRFGHQLKMVACPIDPNWKKYYFDLLSYYVSEVKPEFLWIEDDFRLHNHAPLDWGGCFCPLHMKAFCEKLGKEETREEFVAKLSEEEPTPERRAWLEVSHDSMLELAKQIGDVVAAASPETKVALMSSPAKKHEMEGRRWEELHRAFNHDGTMIDRLHLPSYRQEEAKRYYFQYNGITMVNRAFLGDECLIYPELENSSFSRFVKDPRFLSFQVESAIPCGIDGMTYNIFQHGGDGCQEELGYGQALKPLWPYLTAVKALKLRPSSQKGLVFPIDEDSVYHRHQAGFWNLEPEEFDLIGYFSSMGFSYHLDKGKEFHHQIVILSGDNVWNFQEEELRRLFEDNFVLVDGGAALALGKRGRLSLIHATRASRYGKEKRENCFEMLLKGAVNGIHHYRASSQRRMGDFVSIDYEEGISPITALYDPFMRRTGNGVVLEKGFMVFPYAIHGCEETDFFVTLRRTLFEKAFLAKDVDLADSEEDGVYCYLDENEERNALVLVNATESDFSRVHFRLNRGEIKSIREVSRKGSLVKRPFAQKGREIVLPEPFSCLSSKTFLLEFRK